ncbi:MAG: translocation/assembly module TamB domain-containing protein [Sphaerochaetaceae bacterium]|jgi:hypothetical protein|nr:hypothetical protein [Spirochaetales bacterium]
MKNHTTPSTVLISIILLIVSIVALVILVGSFDILPNAGDFLLRMLPEGGDFKISIDSVSPSLFQKIVLNSVVVEDQNSEVILSLEEVTIDLPLYALFIKKWAPQTIYIEGHGAIVNLNLNLLNGEGGEFTLPSIKVALKLYFDQVKVESGQHSLALKEGLLEANLHGGEVGFIDLKSDSLFFSGPGATFSSEAISGRVDTLEQVALSATQSRLSLDSLDGDASISKLNLYLKGNLLEGSGTLSGSAAEGVVNFPQIEGGFTSLATAVSVEQFKIKEVEAAVSALWGRYAQFGTEIALLNGLYRDGYEVQLFSSDTLRFTYEDSEIARLEVPQILLSDDGELGSLLVNVESLAIPTSTLLNNYQIEKVDIDKPHFLIIDNYGDNRLNLQSSFSLSGVSINPLLGDFEGKFSAAIELLEGNEVAFGELAFNDLTASNLYGNLSGFFHYNHDETTLSGTIDHSANIGAQLSYDLSTNLARFSLLFSATPLGEFSSLLRGFAPTVAEFIDDETLLSGNIIGLANLETLGGRATSELAFTDIVAGEGHHSFATTFNGSLDDNYLYVDLATLATESVRLAYGGTFNLEHLFPEGNLTLSSVESGDILIGANFRRLEEHLYGYDLALPTVGDIKVLGEVSWDAEGRLKSSGDLELPLITYPYLLTGNLKEASLLLESNGMDLSLLSGDEVGHLLFALTADNFPLPPLKEGFLQGEGNLSGHLRGNYALTNNILLIEGEALELNNLSWRGGEPWKFHSDLEADNNELRFKALSYKDPYGSYNGELSLNYNPIFSNELNKLSFDLSLEGEGGEGIFLTLFPNSEESALIIYAEVKEFPLSHLNLIEQPLFINATLLGETNFSDVIVGDLKLDFSDRSGGQHGELSGRLERDKLVLEEGRYAHGNIVVELPKALFPFAKSASVDLNFSLLSPIKWRDATTRTSLNLAFALPPQDNFIGWLKELPKVATLESPLIISHYDTSIMGQIGWDDGMHHLTYDNNIIRITPFMGGTLKGYFSLIDNSFELSASEGFPIPIEMRGTIGPRDISVEVPYIEIDLHHINAIMEEPIIDFISGKLNGSLWIEGPIGNPEFFGTLTGDYLDLTTFWTPQEVFSLKNPVVTISEQLGTVAASTVSTINSGGRRSRGLIEMEAALKNWSLEYYRIQISDLIEPIALWLPLVNLNLNVETNVSGTFIIEGNLDEETLLGDIYLTDGVISFGIPPLPSWLTEKTRTSIDMSISTGKNVSLIYPNFDSPILRATFAENQKIDLSIVAPQMTTTIGGDLAFRSGEIYYVQKNFYVTEGALKFSSGLTELTGDATPALNLRARLREFDFEGNRVDIYLILQDSPLSALEPRFESIPLKSTNEILELLGQNIVTGGSGSDSGFSSVVALASAATDVVSRLGLLQNTTISLGFSSVIRNFLGLDVFTIRTNLLANIIYDALPGLIGDTSVTPLARYLDNTTMFIGKYISEELYFQGMLHFRRDPRGKGSSFLGGDLKLETEVSLEWTTPLATFSVFTQPEELSVFDLFDTMGFSVTKRFDF